LNSLINGVNHEGTKSQRDKEDFMTFGDSS